MNGFDRLAGTSTLLYISPGECDGRDCMWGGDVDPVEDPYDGTAEWQCPSCGTYCSRQIYEPE